MKNQFLLLKLFFINESTTGRIVGSIDIIFLIICEYLLSNKLGNFLVFNIDRII